MIIMGSIVGVLLPYTSIFMRACGAKTLIENTNESRARACASKRALRTFYRMQIFERSSIEQRTRLWACDRDQSMVIIFS